MEYEPKEQLLLSEVKTQLPISYTIRSQSLLIVRIRTQKRVILSEVKKQTSDNLYYLLIFELVYYIMTVY